MHFGIVCLDNVILFYTKQTCGVADKIKIMHFLCMP